VKFTLHRLRTLVVFLLLLATLPAITPMTNTFAAQGDECVNGIGSSQSCPATSPQEIFNLHGTTSDGIYWIKVNGNSTQVFLKMNRTGSDNGAWVLLMKGARGTNNFGYDSDKFTSNTTTLNTTSLSDDVTTDAKFSAYNSLSIVKLLAVLKNPDTGTITSDGDIASNSFGGHVWLETFSATTAYRKLDSATVLNNPSGNSYLNVPATKWKTSGGNQVFSYQEGFGRYGFNNPTCSSAGYAYRWGITWNNEPDFTSCDVVVGIGLQPSPNSGGSKSGSPGDQVRWTGAQFGSEGTGKGKGNTAFQIWGKVAEPSLGAPTSITASHSNSGQVNLTWSAPSGSPIDYVVQYKTSASSTYSNSFIVSDQLSASISGLTNGATYDFRVIARTASNSTSSANLSASTINFTLKNSQSLSFSTQSYSKVFGDTQTVTATSVGIGAITYSVGASTACTVSGETVTITSGTGSCVITASRASDANYLAANSIDSVTITVSKANQVGFILTSTSGTYLSNLTLTTSGGNGAGAVSYATTGTNSAGCSIFSATSLTSTSAGTCQVVATKLGNDNYLPTYDTQTITFSKASLGLGISLTGSSLVKYGDTTTVTYSTNRSLGSAGIANLTGSISYSTESSNSCSVNSSTGVITMVAGSGACSVKVALSSDTNYLDTSSATVSVTPRKADTLTVTTTEPTPLTYTGSSVGVTPSITVSGLVNNDSAAGATFTYSRATTCATGGVCLVGDTGPGGGIVFYVSESAINAADGISTGGLYLEAAPSTFSKTTFTWCAGFTNSNTTTIGGTSSAIGTGAMNTKIVSSRCSGGAVYEAANLTHGGKSDWFLPSAGELLQMYNQKSILEFGTGTTAANYLYWGSNETENWVAASLVPAGGVGGQNKAQATPYWPIRAFSPSATTYSPSTTAPTNAGSYTITSSVLTLSGGRSTDNYLSVIYDTSTLTINKANQSIFSNYSSLEAVLGSAFTIYPFGGSGDGAVYLSISNGTATGCSATTASVTASTAGTCVLTVTKSANENYNQAQSSFAITFFYFVPAPTPQVSTTPTQIAIDAPTAWSAVATAAPEITSFTPSSGPVGTVVTVTGTGFDGVTSVKIGRKALITVSGVNSTTLTAVIPAGTTSGPIVVTNEYGSDFSDSNFTVTFVDTP
jgi:hypothetical protein